MRGLDFGGRPPRVLHLPADVVSSSGQEVIDLADQSGLKLDPWQQDTLRLAMGELANGDWAATQVGIEAPRQNGKGVILQAREIAGLFLFHEPLQIHTAHLFKTSAEAFLRVLHVIEGCPDLSRQVKRVSRSHGEEGIETTKGCRLQFATRTGGGARGLTAPVVYLDEAMILTAETLSALMFVLAAIPNHQLWLLGSSGMVVSEVWSGLRASAVAGDDPRLAFAGWEAPPGCVDDPLNPDHIADANPAFPHRITLSTVESEYRTFLRAKAVSQFLRERLGQWDGNTRVTVFDAEVWQRAVNPDVTPSGTLSLGVDVAPDRKSAAVAVSDHLGRCEVIVAQPGTGWVVALLAELAAKYSAPVTLERSGPAGSLVPDLTKAGVSVTELASAEMDRACSFLLDAMTNERCYVRTHSALDAAALGAVKRVSGDSWRWDRSHAEADISSLVAVTLAFWGACGSMPQTEEEPVQVYA